MLSILHLTAALSLLARLVFTQSDTTPVTGKLGDALIVGSNPAGPVYIATFRNLVATTVRGTVVSHGTPDGMGVSFAVAISGLPQEGGPFRYHIHDQQVPEDGNCAGTLAHLDPYIRGEAPPCNASAPQTCQVGDLSGKHGTATEPAFSASYVDLYASLTPGIGVFFGNRSVVVHFANSTRLACANFELASGNPANATNTTVNATATATGGVVVVATSTVVGSGASTASGLVGGGVGASGASGMGTATATATVTTTVDAAATDAVTTISDASATSTAAANGKVAGSLGMAAVVGLMAVVL